MPVKSSVVRSEALSGRFGTLVDTCAVNENNLMSGYTLVSVGKHVCPVFFQDRSICA